MIVVRVFCLAIAIMFVNLSCHAQPITIARGESDSKPRQPQLAVAEDGQVFVSYGSGNKVFVVRSDDRGQTFSEEKQVGELPKLALGMRRGPRIATAGDSVVVAAISREAGDPVIKCGGREERVVAAWEELSGNEFRIAVKVLHD